MRPNEHLSTVPFVLLLHLINSLVLLGTDNGCQCKFACIFWTMYGLTMMLKSVADQEGSDTLFSFSKGEWIRLDLPSLQCICYRFTNICRGSYVQIVYIWDKHLFDLRPDKACNEVYLPYQRLQLTGMDMDSRVWGTLPTDLLQLVFSRLPVQDMCKLRVLCKTWKQNIDSVNSDFSHLLEQTTYPSMFGVISLKSERQFCGMVVDVKANQRQGYTYSCNACAFEIDPSENFVTTMGASDGGLVCFVSRGTMRPKSIVVMNPLTGKKLELPGLHSMGGHVASNFMPSMVQLTMDRQTWQYKVIIVGSMDRATGRHMFAQIYDSMTKGWMVVGPELQHWDRIYGYSYRSSIDERRRLNGLALIGPCVYDFVAERLRSFGKNSDRLVGGPAPAAQGVPLGLPLAAKDNIAHAVWKNHLFVLRSRTELAPSMPLRDCFISEYVWQEGATAWVEVGRILDLPFHEISGLLYSTFQSFFLDACKGFLLLVLNHSVGYVYDLSGRFWVKLPPITRRPGLHLSEMVPLDLLCELRWNATP